MVGCDGKSHGFRQCFSDDSHSLYKNLYIILPKCCMAEIYMPAHIHT